MNKWSKLLVKDEISDFLIEQLETESLNLTTDDARIIKKKVESKEDVKLLKKIVFENRQNISESLYEDLIEEISEISSDLKWKKTKRDQTTIYINDWTQEFYDEFRSYEKFADVYIGGNLKDDSIIFVTGVVNSKCDIDELKEYVNSKNPKLELLFKVKIKNE